MDGIDLSAVTARPALPIVLRPAALSQVPAGLARPEVRGKFLFAGGEKLLVRGVTYGTFRPGNDGVPYPAPVRVDADFAAMRKAGLNAVRTYTVPPEWMLDAACRHGLRIMVGLPWEQHVTFLDVRRAPGGAGLCRGQRDPGADRPLARTPARGVLPGAALRCRQSEGSGGPGHVRPLSHHRVPGIAVPRSRDVQRVPRGPGVAGSLPRQTPEPRGRPAADHGRDRTGQPPERGGDARRRAGVAGAGRVRRRLRRRVRLFLDR